MGEPAKQRGGARERLFRRVNEAIGRGQWPGDEESLATYRCECANRDCNRMVELTPREYERIRDNPRHFIVVAGHQHPELEIVVEQRPGYVVVEKLGAAGRSAEAEDPRR